MISRILFGIRSNFLSFLRTFGTVLLGLSFPLGLHAGKHRFFILFRQIGSLDSDVRISMP